MATTALGLALQISASTAGLAKSVNEVNQKLDSMAEAGKKSAKDLAILKTIEIGRALIDGVTALAGALSSAAASAKGLFDDARNAIDAVGKLADQTGVSAEAIQAYGLAAQLSGVSTEEFARSLQKMTVRLGELEEGTDADIFGELGLSINKLREQGAEETFEQIADAISGLATDAERAAAANQIFGRTGVTLLPLLNQGAEALKVQRQEAEALGLVLTGDQVDSVEAMNDSFTKIGATINGIVGQVTSYLAPTIEKIATQILDMVKQVGVENITKTITDALFAFADTFLGGLQTLAEVLAQIADGILKILGTLGVVEKTADEKELERIREQATRTRMLPGGQFGGARQQRIFDPTEEQAARIAELEARIQMRAEGGLGQVLVGGIESLRATLNETREQFAQPPEAPQATVDATRGVERA
ncbi:MAG: phage tail tape measure protein, partial [Ilumatobacteraceae bacterium]